MLVLRVLLAASFAAVGCLTGQCSPALVPGGAVAGVAALQPYNTEVMASTMWDPDGAGPASPLLVLGGSFQIAGNLIANSVVAVHPTTGACQALGPGFTGFVRSLAVAPNGELLAGGSFQSGTSFLTPLMRWTGSFWAEVGPGQLSGAVHDILALPNGDVVVGGNCVLPAYANSWCVARWDGQTWLPMGAGFQNIVNAVVQLPNGDIVAGGDDWSTGYIARWTGTTWVMLGGGLTGPIKDMAVAPNGDLFVVGQFQTPQSQSLASWNGTAWSYVATQSWSPYPVYPKTVAVLPSGDVLLGGLLGDAQVLRGSGGTWAPLGGAPAKDGSSGLVGHLAVLANGEVIAGGRFQSLHGVGAAGVSRWRANAWESVTPGTAGTVQSMASLANGDVVAVGNFHQIGGVVAHQAARFDGQQWHAMSASSNGPVQRVFVRGNGDVMIGGTFTMVDGRKASGIARWNGTQWERLGNSAVSPSSPNYNGAFADMPNGDLLAATWHVSGSQTSGVGRWNGSTWSPVGWGLGGTIRVLRVLANGHIIAAGDLNVNSTPNVRVARWDGLSFSWTALGNLQSGGLRDLLVLDNGDLLVSLTSGNPASIDPVWRWNGVAWAPVLGLTGSADTLRRLPNGDVLVSGSLQIAGQATDQMARWNGTTWSWYGPGSCSADLLTANGALWVIPWRAVLGGTIVGSYAHLEPTCPANAVAVGSGCTGSGGPVELGAESLPWLGGTFRAVATGIPDNALVLGVRGLTPTSIPLASLLPQGGLGCALLATVDQLDVLPASAGTVFPTFAIPNAAALVGQTMRYQVLPMQFDPLGNLTAITSSNALALTFGRV